MQKCAGGINYAHCTYAQRHSTKRKMFVRVHRACAAAVKTFLAPNRAKDREKHFQPSAEAFLRRGGTRKRGFRGEFSDDGEEEKGGCLEFWSTCFLND